MEVPVSRKENVILIEVLSAGYHAGDHAKIIIQTSAVKMDQNESGHYRGLNIVIINPENNQVVLSKVYDTYKTSKDLDDLIALGIPEGYIVIAACKDECTANLSNEARVWFSHMGSTEILELGYR